jgi:hypothetical protein
MQTKYTALLVPAVLVWYGLCHGQVWRAALAAALAAVLFAGWEAVLFAKYGRSHFLFHLSEQSEASGGILSDKATLLPPLVGHLGCLAFGIALWAFSITNRKLSVAIALCWCIGVAAVCCLPYREAILVPGREPGHAKLTLASLVWRTTGAAVLLAAAGWAAMILRGPSRSRRSPDTAFVVGWVFLELAGYFALTPFPAGRRVLGVVIALAVVAARYVSRRSRVTRQPPPGWVLPFAIAGGVLFSALDTFDALPEKSLANQAADAIRPHSPPNTWYVGHWGFQYYCERGGMEPLIPGQSALQPGDCLVVPLYPDDNAFYRPHSGFGVLRLRADAVEPIAEFVWDDWLSAQTIPNFYGGTEPIQGRDHPRLRVGVYRIVKGWKPK